MERFPFLATEGGVTIAVHLTPKAPATRIVGIAADATGDPVLKAQVTELPERGKANAALIKLVAKTWKLPSSSLSIAAGRTSRRKLVRIAGTPDEILNKLNKWLRTYQ